MRQKILMVIAIVLIGAVGVWWYFGFTLDFMQFFAAEQKTSVSVNQSSNQAPTTQDVVTNAISGIVSCAPATQTVAKGASVTLTASGGTGGYTWFMPERALSSADTAGTKTGSSITIAYDVPGTKKVTVQAARADGSANIDSVACTVVVQ